MRDHGFGALADIEAYEPVGCSRCGRSGYRGRTGLYEVMSVSEEIRELAVKQGRRRLREDGLETVRQGRTSSAEVARGTSTGA